MKHPDAVIKLTTTIGGSIEWYQIGLFVFWPIASKGQIGGFDVTLAELSNTLAALTLVGMSLFNGALRAAGGWFFGKEGDEKGRKFAFGTTICFGILPSLALIGLTLTQTYSHWIEYSTWILIGVKFFQGIPAGGELPGAICCLGEISKNQKSQFYKCSYALVGPQVGLGLSAVMSFGINIWFPYASVHAWQILFGISAGLGLIALIFRHYMQETAEYLDLKTHHKILHKPLRVLFKNYPRRLVLGATFPLFEIISFSVISMVPFQYMQPPFSLGGGSVALIVAVFAFLCAILLPILGKTIPMKMKFPWIKFSTWGILCATPILYLSLVNGYFISSLIILALQVLFLSIQSVYIPFSLVQIFPVEVRYTGIAFSFNISDGIVWGAVAGLCSIWLRVGSSDFVWILVPAAALFLVCLRTLKSFDKISQGCAQSIFSLSQKNHKRGNK